MLRIGGKEITDLSNAKVLTRRLQPGDAFMLRAGGGGGFGSPLERPIERVQEDVRQGYVSVKSAGEWYGLALDPQTLRVDTEETSRHRAKLKGQI